MPRGAVLIPYALRGDTMVHVSEVESGLHRDCLCVACGGALVARKGTKITHHFAHHIEANCNGETALHELGKRILARRIETAIAEQSLLPFEWKCEACPDTHRSDLAARVAHITVEAYDGPYRPDITLTGREGSPFAVVEVVVTHPPDVEARRYYSAQGRVLIQFRIASGDDLEALQREPVLRADTATHCQRPKCTQCGGPLYRNKMHVFDVECWKCRKPMPLAIADAEGEFYGAKDFTPEEARLAQRLGARLGMRYSRTMGERYLASTCPHCDAFIGDLFTHDYYYAWDAENGHDAGWACHACLERKQQGAPPDGEVETVT